jgi:UDP-N-acetylglucosamine--N-acetylmuramyl-(pentapeptide) pyrophosphoryl-undecaprenol N-acetylglucosamine transferase
MRVVIAGGGTAGHVFPAVALADRLADDQVGVSFIGSPSGQEARLVPEAGYRFDAVDAAPLRRELSLRTLRAPAVALGSVRSCMALVEGADVVVGMGGYVSVPAVLAARRRSIPIVLHEQNAVPGLANRLLARIARVVGLSFADAAGHLPRRVRTVVTGDPVRPRIVAVPRDRDQLAAEAFAALGLAEDRTTVVVFGGSQGALHVNRTLAGALPLLAERDDLQVLALTGPDHLASVADAIEPDSALRVVALPYLDRMELAYAVADLAVARAGATSIAEMTVCGIPAVLIPYPHATENHQEANARELEQVGAASVYLDAALRPEGLAERIRAIVDDDARRAAMAAAARSWAKPDADERLASLVREAAA